MVVFLFLFLAILFIIFFSSFEISAKNIQIKNFKDLKEILKSVIQLNINDVLRIINMDLKIRILLFDIIPLLTVKVSNEKLQRMFNKVKSKDDELKRTMRRNKRF